MNAIEVYDTYYKKNIESLQWEETKVFYNKEIKRLIYNKILKDDMGILQKIYDNPTYYDEAIKILSLLNTYDSSFMIQMHSVKSPHIYSHVFGLLISAQVHINILHANETRFKRKPTYTCIIS